MKVLVFKVLDHEVLVLRCKVLVLKLSTLGLGLEKSLDYIHARPINVPGSIFLGGPIPRLPSMDANVAIE